MKEAKNYTQHTYTGYSITQLIAWKISRLKNFIAVYVRYVLFKGVNKNLKTIRKYYKTKEGPALVAATGPSLEKIPLDILDFFAKKKALFGVNDYAITKKGYISPPEYQIICDDYFWHEDQNSRAAELKEVTSKNLGSGRTFCIVQPYFKEEIIKSPETLYINTNSLPGFTKKIDISKTTGLPTMSTHFAIATAIYLGYSPIYVVGFDLNQFLSLKIIDGQLVTQKIITANQITDTEYTFWKARESVSDFLSFTANAISSLKLFKNSEVVVLGEDSMIDTVNKISFSELQKILRL